MYNAIICRYHEIATKGHNRNMFERCLVDNIRHQTRNIVPCKVQRVRGRVWLEPKEERDFTPEEVSGLCAQLKKVFGLETVVNFTVLVHRLRREKGNVRVEVGDHILRVSANQHRRVGGRYLTARRVRRHVVFRKQGQRVDAVGDDSDILEFV